MRQEYNGNFYSLYLYKIIYDMKVKGIITNYTAMIIADSKENAEAYIKNVLRPAELTIRNTEELTMVNGISETIVEKISFQNWQRHYQKDKINTMLEKNMGIPQNIDEMKSKIPALKYVICKGDNL